jgi:hypothetical protein
MTVNRLVLGDNLEILKSMKADSVDLVYLAPPFSALCAGLPLSPLARTRLRNASTRKL